MKSQVWSLPPQEVPALAGVRTLQLAAWQIADHGHYVFLSRDPLPTSSPVIDVVQGEHTWYLTHQYHPGPLPLIEAVDSIDQQTLDAYLLSDIGRTGILISMAALRGLSLPAMSHLFRNWLQEQHVTD